MQQVLQIVENLFDKIYILGLFVGAILESGSALSPGSLQRTARETAFGTATILNATFEEYQDSEALLEYLITVTAEDLNAASLEYYNSVSNFFLFDFSDGVTIAHHGI